MAIAFDTSTNGANTGINTNALTWTHTNTGSNLLLLVGAITDRDTGDVLTATYAGTSMTKLIAFKQTTSLIWMTLFYLAGPTTGANSVTVSKGGASFDLAGLSASYTGAAQSGIPDAQSSGSSSGTSLARSVTTVADNCWAMMIATSDSGDTINAGAGTTKRVGNTAYISFGLLDGNAAVTPPGSTTLNSSWATTGSIASAMISFAPPSAAAAVVQSSLLLTNVG